MSFESFGLSAEIVRAVSEHGYTIPTPIQTKTIPAVLNGRDIMAGAQTGTGKTAGFTLPILQILGKEEPNKEKRAVRCLILTPTRELAAQVHQSVKTYGKYTGLRSAEVYGGVNINPQVSALKKGVDILVATPGRLLDHVQQKNVDLSQVRIFVLDEADRMLDMGFIRDIRKIMQLLPKQRQNLLFSATFSSEMKGLASSLLHKPEVIQVTPSNSASTQVEHIVHPVDHSRKRELLVNLIQNNSWSQILIFVKMKHTANRLAQQLNKAGIHADSIHGDKSQSQRTRALENFKKGAVTVLVATDVASRGLDIQQLPLVINYEMPTESENYIHRIGRTGRAGNTGKAISLVAADEYDMLGQIEDMLNVDIEKVVIPGFEPDPRISHKVVPRKRRVQPPLENPQDLATAPATDPNKPVEHWSRHTVATKNSAKRSYRLGSGR
jgi:ATP-dependent RNA helicase RhlE